MEGIVSKDGTIISYERRGSGPPLVLVHGISATAARWAAVTPGFAKHFTTYAVNRRGREGSGDSGGYAIEREFEDIVALIESIGEPVDLVGHSFGGILALEAAMLSHNIRKLVLYEPSMLICRSVEGKDSEIARLKALLEEGDRSRLVGIFLNRFVRVSFEEIDSIRTSRGWLDRLSVAHTIPRELYAQESCYRFDPDRYRPLSVSTLLLVGSESDDDLKAGAKTLHDVLPDSRLVGLPGQKHTAMESAPQLFVREVLDFLLQQGRRSRAYSTPGNSRVAGIQ
jgi:pimeloyl-ACP methyl ester carboxylesterase